MIDWSQFSATCAPDRVLWQLRCTPPFVHVLSRINAKVVRMTVAILLLVSRPRMSFDVLLEAHDTIVQSCDMQDYALFRLHHSDGTSLSSLPLQCKFKDAVWSRLACTVSLRHHFVTYVDHYLIDDDHVVDLRPHAGQCWWMQGKAPPSAAESVVMALYKKT